MTSISSSAVEGALLVRMRRTERELREIEGEVQRWKETLSRGTRSDSRAATELSNAGFDELPGLCAEALQATMQLRRRAETVRRSMTYIRNTASEQSAARNGHGSSSPSGNPDHTSPASSSSPSSKPTKTFQAGGSSALAYFVEDFVNSEFGMQEQAWWDVMSDIEAVEALAVSLLSVPSSEVSEQRIRQASSMHQTRPAEWTVENWDASISPSVGMPAVMMGNQSFADASAMMANQARSRGGLKNTGSPFSPNSSSASALYGSMATTPVSDLLLRRLQEQNRAKGLYNGGSSNQSNANGYGGNDRTGSAYSNRSGHSGYGNNNNTSDQQTSAHVGPIFASLAANPEVISAADFDRLPKSDPLALFMSQMGAQLEEEQRRLKQLSGGVSDPFRFDNNNNNNNTTTGGGGSNYHRDPLLASGTPSAEPSFLQVRPGGNVYSPERMGADYLQRQREEEERLRQIEKESTEAIMKKKKEEADRLEAEEQERLEQERKKEQARREKEEAAEAERKKKEAEEKAAKEAEKKRKEEELAREEAEMKRKEEEIARQIKEQEAKAAAAEKLRALELAEEEAARAAADENPQQKQEEKEKEEKAATRIQAAHRGSVVRKNLKKDNNDNNTGHNKKEEQEEKKKEEVASTSEKPSTSEEPKKKSKEEQTASKNENKPEEKEEDKQKIADAALKIQTAQRGNAARKELQRRRAESVAANKRPEISANEEAVDEKNDNNKPEEEKVASPTTSTSAKTPVQEEASGAEATTTTTEKKNENDDTTSEKEKEEKKKEETTSGNNEEIEKQVEAALASGEWKKVKDAKGRTYYYHPSSKKTTWDLAKELAKKCKHGKQ